MIQRIRTDLIVATTTAVMTWVIVMLAVILSPLATCHAAIRSAEVFGQVNAERVAQGVPALTVSPALVKAAQAKADDMATAGYFAHRSPSGKTVATFLGLAGYRYRVAGENLAQGFTEAQVLTTALMASPGHRANILDPDFQETGIGIAQVKKGTLIVQLFGSRL
jgi:uncharacterized protein YkwD